MRIEDIRNLALRNLFNETGDASATIVAEAGDALEESGSDEELIANWQSRLESLHEETQRFWGGLENIKQAPSPLPTPGAIPALFVPSGTRRELAYRWIDEYKKDRGIGWSPLSHKPATGEEYSAVFDRFVKDGYGVYAEFRDGRYHVYVKRGQYAII